MEKIKDLMNMETVHVALDFWKENGLRALIKNPAIRSRDWIMITIMVSGMS